MGGSPGLVLWEEIRVPKGRGFESRCQIPDGHNIFSFVIKIVMFV